MILKELEESVLYFCADLHTIVNILYSAIIWNSIVHRLRLEFWSHG